MAERDGVMDVAVAEMGNGDITLSRGKFELDWSGFTHRTIGGMSFANVLHRTSHGENEELKL